LSRKQELSGFEIDDDYKVRLATNMTADGGSEIFMPNEDGGWRHS